MILKHYHLQAKSCINNHRSRYLSAKCKICPSFNLTPFIQQIQMASDCLVTQRSRISFVFYLVMNLTRKIYRRYSLALSTHTLSVKNYPLPVLLVLVARILKISYTSLSLEQTPCHAGNQRDFYRSRITR